MNNLFRINKNNLDTINISNNNFLLTKNNQNKSNKIKSNHIIINSNSNSNSDYFDSIQYQKTNIINNKINNNLINKYNCEKIKEDNEPFSVSYSVEKKATMTDNLNNQQFIDEQLRFYGKSKPEFESESEPKLKPQYNNLDSNQTQSIKINNDMLIFDKNIENIINTNSGDLNVNKTLDKKVIWEYGKSGIKIDKLKKYQSKNLAILFYINSLFIDFIDYYPGLILNEIIDKFKNDNDNHNNNNDNDTSIDKQKNNNLTKCLYWNNFGSILLKSNDLFIKITRDKLNGIYKILDCGYFKFYDININEELLNKYKIPNLNLLLTHPDNVKYFFKIIKIFELTQSKINTNSNKKYFNTNIFKTRSNFLNQIDFDDILKYLLPEIIEKINNKENLFDVSNKFTFYIKMYDTHTKAFLIDRNTKLFYYWISVENFSKPIGYLFMYVIELDSKCRLLNYDKDFLTEIVDFNKISCIDNKVKLNKPIDTINSNIVDTINLNIVDTINLNIVDTINSNIVDTINSNIVDTIDSDIVDTIDSDIINQNL